MRSSTLLLAMVFCCLKPGGAEEAEPAEERIALAVVNGDTITTANLDQELISTHTRMNRENRARYDYRKLLDKLVNDMLLIQDAESIGLDTEPEVADRLRRDREREVVRTYVRRNYVAPDSVEDEAVRAYFEKYYWKIELRQVSVRTREEADSLITAIRSGASMDSLARKRSLDSHRYRGGLHNFKYWADVENAIRDHLPHPKDGQLVGPFPFREAFSIVRVERVGPIEVDALEKYEKKIRAHLLSEKNKKKWKQFLQREEKRTKISVNTDLLGEIRGDSADLFRGSFLEGSENPVLETPSGYHVTEVELRKEISHKAMQAGTAAFDTLYSQGLESKRSQLVLLEAADRAGLFADTELIDWARRNRNQVLLEVYLAEMIAPQIKFNREDFQKYYEDHKEEYRGSDEVLLDMMIFEDEEEAKSVESRLQAGADFDHLKRVNQGVEEHDAGEPKWSAIDVFSAEIVEALNPLKAGESTAVIDIGKSWSIFHVRDRRPGRVKAMEEVEMDIRRVKYQEKFAELMDEHLARLRERSDIQLVQENIDVYFGTGM